MVQLARERSVHRTDRKHCRARQPKSVFLCCGSVGIVLTIAGGIMLGVGQHRQKAEEHLRSEEEDKEDYM